MLSIVEMERLLLSGTGKIFWDVSSRALSFVLSVLVARKLGAAGYGSFAVYWYGAWMLSQATDLGLHLVTLRSLSKDRSASTLPVAVAVKGIATGVLLAAGLPFAGRFPVVLFLLLAHLASSWVELAGVVLRSGGFIAREGLLLVTLRASWLLAALWALSSGSGLETLALVLALSSLPALALSLSLVSRVRGPARFRVSRVEMGRLLRSALPFALGSAITLFYLRVDLLVVASLRGASEAGLFQSAFRLFEATFVLSGGIAAGTFPTLAARVGEQDFPRLSRFVLVLLLSVSAPLACLFWFGGEPILTLLYGGEFREAAGPLAILGLGLVAVYVNALTSHLLLASGRSRRYVLSMVVRLGVAVALDFALVPSFGAIGAAAAVAAAEWSLAAFTLASVFDLLGISSGAARPLSPKEASPCS